MSISTQQIQAVVRTYNKQLKLSGINKRDKHLKHPCVTGKGYVWQVESNRHPTKQRRHKHHRMQKI